MAGVLAAQDLRNLGQRPCDARIAEPSTFGGPINNEKGAKLPLSGLEGRYTLEGDRAHYRFVHLLGEIHE